MGIGLTDLPYTIFTDIISRLSATEAIVCRRISRDAYAALTRNELCISLILEHFPRSKECRKLSAHLKADDKEALERGDWAAVFATLARRYFNLQNARCWKSVKVLVLKEGQRIRSVTPWNKFLSLNGKTAPLHFRDPVWTVEPAERLLVYPALFGQEASYRARDLDTGLEADVPFDMRGKITRRVRLSHGILVIEWCEQEAWHALNETDFAHRHYATAYTVRRTGSCDGVVIPQRHDGGSASTPAYTLGFEFRCEWKIHDGLAVNEHDRFFSTHNGTHYAIYTWHPARSSRGEDEPLECLTIWEFGTPSPYRPSEDPSGALKPADSSGPRIIRSMANSQLSQWNIRQRNTPGLRALAFDECTWDASGACAYGQLFFIEEMHKWAAGPQGNRQRPFMHHVKSTGIPLIGQGPGWVDECGRERSFTPRFCKRWGDRLTVGSDTDDVEDDYYEDEDPSKGIGATCYSEKIWSHSETWPGRAPCWRHDDFPYLTMSEVFDAAAGIRIIARHCLMLETLSTQVRPKIRIRIRNLGVRAGDLKTPPPSPPLLIRKRKRRSSSSGSSSSSSSTSPRRYNHHHQTRKTNRNTAGNNNDERDATMQGPDGKEVQFADGMWSEIMSKGLICGDERWLVGEDAHGDVTIVVF